MFLTKLSTQNPMSQLVFTARELWKIPKTNFLIYQWRIRSLQIQLRESQEQIAEKEMLLREKDETLVEYLAQINEMDNDLISGQGSGKNAACPLCFKDMSTGISENSTSWVEIGPCGHRTCWECYITTAENLNKERKKKLNTNVKGYEITYRYICGICDEPAKHLLMNQQKTHCLMTELHVLPFTADFYPLNHKK